MSWVKSRVERRMKLGQQPRRTAGQRTLRRDDALHGSAAGLPARRATSSRGTVGDHRLPIVTAAPAPPPHAPRRSRPQRRRIKIAVALRVQVGRELRVLDRKRSPALNRATVLRLAPPRAARTASPAPDAVIYRRLPLVPAVPASPPHPAVRSARHRARIKLTVAGLVKLGCELRPQALQRSPPGHWSHRPAGIVRRRPEPIPSDPCVGVLS